MVGAGRPVSLMRSALTIFELIFHNTVRAIRKEHRDAVLAIVFNLIQMIVMIAIFFVVFDMLGIRRLAVRGDFLLYVMSGIFVFMTNIKAVGAVAGAEGPVSPMMQHLTMTPIVSVCASALSALYTQFMSMAVVLILYHLLWQPISFANPVGAALCLILAWFSGCCLGLVFLGMKPWLPRLTGILQMLYTRVNMFASGKMFLANNLPTKLFAIFSLNPLFHIIDQGRGYVFVNYNPMRTTLVYPITVSLILAAIGILLVTYTNRRISLSWSAGR